MRELSQIIAGMLLIAATISPAHSQTPAGSSAQQYPNRLIRMIAIGPGGTIDFGARVLAQGMSGGLNQQVIVDNRPSGVIPGETVARAQPDGYTLLFAGGNLWVTPLMQDRVPYDVVRDFAPISLVYSVPLVLLAHPSLPVTSIKELIALAKARPGAINYAGSSAGSASTLAGSLFTYMTGVNIVPIPFKDQGARRAALLRGEVQLEFATAGGTASSIKAGKLKALAITSARPSEMFPGVPSIAQAVPGYEAESTAGLLAPAKTPTDLITRLNQEAVRAVNRAEIKDKFITAGADPVGSSPDQFANHIKAEIARMGKLIKALGIREE